MSTDTHLATPQKRPILFSGSMVRAILDGTKTQTRRVISPVQPRDDGLWPAGRDPVPDCPFGAPGDRLWVRETFGLTLEHDDNGEPTNARRVLDGDGVPHWVVYRADHPNWVWTDGDGYAGPSLWRPSIHMPRWASRLMLEVASVRVERLHDISEEDARAEGVEPTVIDDGAVLHRYPARRHFQALWENINGPGSWERNDWCWVVGFRRVEQ